jgi:hypothetical protein
MNREDLIAAMKATASPKPVAVEVKGWGTLHVRPLTVEEVEEASDQKEPADGKKRTFARGAARIICDAKGKRIFDPANSADVELLASQPWTMLQQVMAAADAKGADPKGN